MALSPGELETSRLSCGPGNDTTASSATYAGHGKHADDADPRASPIDWEGTDDPLNPFNWSVRKKWLVTGLSLLATFTSMLNGTAITVAHEAFEAEFGISDDHFPNSYWPVTSWAIGGAIFTLVGLPLMEDFGVRPGFLTFYLAFLVFLIPQALAKTFATLVVCRFFAGGCASIIANTAAGLIGNIWEGDRARTLPISVFMVAFVTGSSSGPVIGAAIFSALPWPWISYIQLIVDAALFPLYWVLFAESRGAVVLQDRARQLRRQEQKPPSLHSRSTSALLEKLYKSVQRPLFMLCTESVAFTFTMWSAFTVGNVYMLTQSVEQVFVGLYGWTPVQAGYVQGAVIVGEILGWPAAQLSRKLYFASARRNTEIPGTPIPEARLYMSLVGSFVGMTGGMFVYGWTAYPFLPWMAPAVGLAMVGFGITVVITAIADYLLDAYSKFAGSCIAGVVLVENLSAAFLPLASQSMYTTLGFHWASTLLGFIALLLSFIPVCLIKWGRHIRARSPFMKEAMIDKRMNPLA